MARKPSVIMNAEERRNAKNSLKEEIKTAKADLKETDRKAKDLRKQLLGLETRLKALTPPKAA